MTLALRPYQVDAIERIRTAIRQGARRIVVVAPTGAGKTIMFTELIRLALAKGHRVLNLAHRLELIDQISGKLDALDLDHGVIQGSHWRVRPWCPVQVASVPTLSRRERLPEASVINVDECHHTTAPSFAGVIKSYHPDTVVLGWTATPERADGTGLGEHYEQIIEVATVPDLIAQGYLVPPKVFAPSTPSVVGVKIVAGDFNKAQLSRAVDRPSLVADVVETWLHLAGPSSPSSPTGPRTTVVFAVSIEHSKHLVDRFVTAGIRAEHLDADTPEDERRAILARVATGETTVVSNVGILTEGWDLPRASCVVQARPTMSRGLYCQMTGRGLRIYCSACDGREENACSSPDHKRDCLILDHAGNCHRHGFVTDPRTYSLEGSRAENRTAIPAVRTCLKCAAVNPASAVVCTFCGTPFPIKRRVIIEKPGKLELQAGQALADVVPSDRLAKALAKWLVEEREHNYSPARAPLIYRKMFGASVTSEILGKARQIADSRMGARG